MVVVASAIHFAPYKFILCGSKVQSLFENQGEFTATEKQNNEIISDMLSSMEYAWKVLETKFDVQSPEENIQ